MHTLIFFRFISVVRASKHGDNFLNRCIITLMDNRNFSPPFNFDQSWQEESLSNCSPLNAFNHFHFCLAMDYLLLLFVCAVQFIVFDDTHILFFV